MQLPRVEAPEALAVVRVRTVQMEVKAKVLPALRGHPKPFRSMGAFFYFLEQAQPMGPKRSTILKRLSAVSILLLAIL